MIKAGIASTKTEAIRMAIMDYREHHRSYLAQKDEDEADKKLQMTGWRDYLEDEKEDKVWNKYLEEEKSG
jgi:hypothetical protein